MSGTLPPEPGTIALGLAGAAIALTPGGPTLSAGMGVPTSTQPNASIYLRNDGTTGSKLYLSSGGGNWTAVA